MKKKVIFDFNRTEVTAVIVPDPPPWPVTTLWVIDPETQEWKPILVLDLRNWKG